MRQRADERRRFAPVDIIDHLLGDDEGVSARDLVEAGRVTFDGGDPRGILQRGDRRRIAIDGGNPTIAEPAEIADEVALAAAEIEDRCVAILGQERPVIVFIITAVGAHGSVFGRTR